MIRPEDYTDVTYAVEEDAFAVITINRPERMNSFRGRTVDELLSAFKHAWADKRVAAVTSPVPATAPSAQGATSRSGPRRAATARPSGGCSTSRACTG